MDLLFFFFVYFLHSFVGFLITTLKKQINLCSRLGRPHIHHIRIRFSLFFLFSHTCHCTQHQAQRYRHVYDFIFFDRDGRVVGDENGNTLRKRSIGRYRVCHVLRSRSAPENAGGDVAMDVLSYLAHRLRQMTRVVIVMVIRVPQVGLSPRVGVVLFAGRIQIGRCASLWIEPSRRRHRGSGLHG